jgi:hypothetical protein
MEVPEITGSNMASLREQYLANEHSGLGPDDLVSLTKQENSIFFRPRIGHSYHHFSGLPIGTTAVFAAYFAELVQSHERATSAFRIIHGKLFAYNSFIGRDVVISAKNPGMCSAVVANSKGKPGDVRPRCWTQLRISTILRFYRGSQPIHAALFGSVVEKTQNLICYWEPKLSLRDFNYIAMHHKVSEELEFTLATALFVSLDKSDIVDFLEKHHRKFDRLFRWFAMFILSSPQLSAYFVPFLEKHYAVHCDSLEIALSLVDLYLATGEIEKCQGLVPLLRMALEIFSEAGIAMAKICLARGDHATAIVYLNASGCISGWAVRDCDVPSFLAAGPRGVACRPLESEEWLVEHPLAGLQFAYFTTLVQVRKAVGPEKFPHFVRRALGSRIVHKPATPDGAKAAAPRPPSADDLDFLYDPGIQDGTLSFAWMNKLPYSKRLKKTVAMLDEAVKRTSGFLKHRHRREQAPLTTQLIFAVQMADDALMESLMTDGRVLSELHKSVLVRAALLGVGPPMEDVMALKCHPETIAERMASPFTNSIGQAFLRHVRSLAST